MQAQTLAFAFIAALYPVGLLAVTFLLSTDRPMALGLSFYAGAVVSLFVVGVLVLTVLRARAWATAARRPLVAGSGSASARRCSSPHGSIWRRPVPQGPKKEPAWRARLSKASPVAVFVTGAILYSPSGSYIAAVQQIATSNAGLASGVQLLIVIFIVLLTVEIPLVAYAVKPEATAGVLSKVERWIDRHGRQALVAGLVVIGGYLVVDGIITLA